MKEVKERCDCNMSHDITFCTNQNCNTVRKCMRYGGCHVMTSDYNSFADFGNKKYDEQCNMFIGEKVSK